MLKRTIYDDPRMCVLQIIITTDSSFYNYKVQMYNFF